MRKCVWLLASLVGFSSLPLFPLRAAEDSGQTVTPHWLSDWEEGRKVARASGRPLFVVFRCEH